jgi:acetolactate synthase-1/2/3 large subunit
MRFDDRVTGTLATYAPKAKKIHIEVDPAEINKNVKVDVALVGDLRAVLEELLPRIPGRDGSAWIKTIEASKGAVAVHDIKNLPDSGHLWAAHVVHDLWRITAGNAIVVTDVGQHQMWEAQYFHHEHPRTLITSGGLGTMGFALPAAIGAKFACPEKEVWVIAGDGGFQMTSAELSTMPRKKSRSTSPSSTTATWAWSASGSSSSTSATTRQRPSSVPILSSWPTLTASVAAPSAPAPKWPTL